MTQTLRIRLSPLVYMALAYDDKGMWEPLGVTVDGYNVTGEPDAIERVMNDIYRRAYGSGWDQPASWEHACQRSYVTCQRALNKQGYQILTAADPFPYGPVRRRVVPL